MKSPKVRVRAVLLGLCISYFCSAAAQGAELCYIPNVDVFVDQCPASDPARDEILSDFRITRDGVDTTPICSEATTSAIPIAQFTDELILLQALRIIYYMDRGRTGQLPWTNKSLYDWLKGQVGGFNFDSTATLNSCCGVWPDGRGYINLTTKDDVQRDFDRTWPYIAEYVGLIMHEARHVDGFDHVGCCPAGGAACDLRYDESNLSPYGIQWWLERAWLDGTLVTGYTCLDTARAATIKSYLLGAANDRQQRFCENPPPALGQDISAPCLDCGPPPTAMDDGPYSVDEGGAIAGTHNILDNDTDPDKHGLTPSIVAPPAHASFFELRSDGTFYYTHDGSETLADSFTYRVKDGAKESGIATVSFKINPVNDAPKITLVGDAAINVLHGHQFDDPGAKAQDAEDGDISVRIVVSGDIVNTRVDGIYRVFYDVVDSGGLAAVRLVRTVSVTNAPPSFATPSTTASIAENSPAGSRVVSVQVVDPNADALTCLLDGSGASMFSIEQGIVVTRAPLDHETQPAFHMTIACSDGYGGVASQALDVTVTDVPEPPVLTVGPGPFVVPEDASVGTTVATVAAADPEGDAITFRLAGGNDAGRFAIDGGGKITVAAPLDFETTPSYTLIVQADDGTTAAVSRAVNIVVSDVAEPASSQPVSQTGSGGGGGGGGSSDASLLVLLSLLLVAHRLNEGRSGTSPLCSSRHEGRSRFRWTEP